MVDLLIDTPASVPFTELHVWIGHYADGTEGMMATDFPLAGMITRHMPLMNSKREVAERLGNLARGAQAMSQHATNRIVRLELRTFRAVTS